MGLHRQLADMQPHDVAAHAFSLVAIGGVLAHWLPTLALIPPSLYYCAMLAETKLVQKWVHKRKVRKRHKRILSRRKA